MKNITKLQFLLFTLAALSLLISIVIYSYETGYERGYDAIYFDKPDVAETLGYEACIFF